jgi:hypothetical protein
VSPLAAVGMPGGEKAEHDAIARAVFALAGSGSYPPGKRLGRILCVCR